MFKIDQNICFVVFLNNSHGHSITNPYIKDCDLYDGASDVDKTREVTGHERHG